MAARKTEASVREELHQLFPQVIFAKGSKVKLPLAKGIHKSIGIHAPHLSASWIRKALADYTGGPTYLRNLLSGRPRFNLVRVEDGFVSDQDEAYSRQRLGWLAIKWSQPRVRLMDGESLEPVMTNGSDLDRYFAALKAHGPIYSTDLASQQVAA